MKRVDALAALGKVVDQNDLFVSWSGRSMTDSWWNHKPGGEDNTISLASLGSISSMALGLAVALPHRRIVALETDGSMLMNTGAMCTLGNERPENLTVLVFDNGLLEEVGGAPSHTAKNTDLALMAKGAGCINAETATDLESFSQTVERMVTDHEFGFLVAKIEPGPPEWPPEKRKNTDGIEDKYRFMRHVEKLEDFSIHGPRS